MSLFGSQLQNALEGAKGKTESARRAKQQQILQKWIPEAVGKGKPRRFRDAAKATTR